MVWAAAIIVVSIAGEKKFQEGAGMGKVIPVIEPGN
jgi:hypothetical protein